MALERSMGVRGPWSMGCSGFQPMDPWTYGPWPSESRDRLGLPRRASARTDVQGTGADAQNGSAAPVRAAEMRPRRDRDCPSRCNARQWPGWCPPVRFVNHPFASNVLRRVQRAPDDCGQAPREPAPARALRQFAPQRELREQMERAAPVRDASARSPESCRPAPSRRSRMRRTRRARSCDALARVRFHAGESRRMIEHVQQHRLNDEAVVVVPMEGRAVTVSAVALVPLLVLTNRVVHAHAIPGRAEALSAASTIAENSSQLLNPGLIAGRVKRLDQTRSGGRRRGRHRACAARARSPAPGTLRPREAAIRSRS